jgi:eukaryotic-like serine/threonine-protein kinase
MTSGVSSDFMRLTTALTDRYRIERELGAGGMATVYLAHDIRHDREVAVKVLRSDLSESLGRDRFLREIHLAARLSHPHILPLFDSGDAGGFLFFVMPVMDGETLRDRLLREPQLPVDAAVRIASQVGDALDYAHRHGVVHRDIKPENILLHEGHALVADFGIGKAVTAAASEDDTLTQIGIAVGTAAYMSPEQAAGDAVDGRSDLFSLGCVLYEMLAGEPPFTGPTLQATIAKRFHHVPPAPSVRRPEVSAIVSDVIARLLEKAPESRMSSGAQMVAALQSRELAAPMSRATGKSVAVLPFASMSANADDGFFADGMTEEIINVLGQLKGLRVATRTSCFAFKDRHDDLHVIGEKLGVQHVLEGSVRKAGSRLRISAQLIEAAGGQHLWSERYDRELVDVFALQDEIANAIAMKLQLSLLDVLDGADTRAGPANVEAYELLLKGRALLWLRGRAIVDALPCFERAVELDPMLAEAHAGIADAYRLMWIYGIAPAAVTLPNARAAIARALAVDDTQPMALAALANITASGDLDIEASLAISDRILARDPLHVQTLCERSLVAVLRSDCPPQRQTQALHHLRVARRADPLNSWAAALESFALSALGLDDDALREARHAVALDPKAFTGRWALMWTLAVLGHDDEAIAMAEETLPMSGRHPRVLAEIAAIHAKRGNTAGARAVLDELRERAAAGFVEQSALAAVAASVGLASEARALLARSIADRETYWQFTTPAFATLLTDPGSAAMLRAVHFQGRGAGV